jgi:ABC-type transport system involved in multi-copper enzyme maturation permease subunit
VNKEKFLKELEKKLKVLSPEEKQDILNEYEDIITEKVKHGKTEEEAVKEFGDLNSLSEEILKSYKIDPKYQKGGNDFLSDCEDLIKKGAQKLTEVTEEVVDSIKKSEKDMDLEMIFEMVIKIVLLLIGIGFLHIPFWIIKEIGQSILEGLSFGHMFFFQGNVIILLWKILIEVAYVAVCALFVLAILKKSVPHSDKENAKKKRNFKDEKIEEKKQENRREEGSVVTGTSRVYKSPISEVLLVLLKLFIFFVFTVPLILLAFGIATVLCILIYLLIKGIGIYAPFVLVLGVFTLVVYMVTIFIHLLFTNKKISAWPFFSSFILIIFGGIFTIEYIWSFTYHTDLQTDKYKKSEEKFEFVIHDGLYVDYDEIEIDNSLEEDKVKIVVEYYDTFFTLDKKEYTYHGEENKKTIAFDTQFINKYSINRFINEIVIQDLKKHELYNYYYLLKPYVKVYVNENVKSKIR